MHVQNIKINEYEKANHINTQPHVPTSVFHTLYLLTNPSMHPFPALIHFLFEHFSSQDNAANKTHHYANNLPLTGINVDQINQNECRLISSKNTVIPFLTFLTNSQISNTQKGLLTACTGFFPFDFQGFFCQLSFSNQQTNPFTAK